MMDIEAIKWWIQPTNAPLLWVAVLIVIFLSLLVGYMTWHGVGRFLDWIEDEKEER